MEPQEDRKIRDAVKNVRSAFYTNKRKQKKLSRKDARRNQRLQKKNKQHGYMLKRYNKEPEQQTSIDVDVKKKRKRKRKKIVQTEDAEDVDLERAAHDAANKQDEKIISSLGKRLKVTNKSDVMKMFKQDGLDYLLEVCEPLTQEQYVDSSDEEYMASKSKTVKKKTFLKQKDDEPFVDNKSDNDIGQKLLFDDGSAQQDDEILAEGDIDDSSEDENYDIAENPSEEDADDCNDENDSEGNDLEEKKIEDEEVIAGKYIPPALRKIEKKNEDGENLKQDRIKKKLKGLLNRVSSAKLPGLTSDIENLYSVNSRNTMNEVLYQLISEACILESLVPQRLVLEHMIIVAALHNTVGAEVGSHFLQALVERFCLLHGKEPPYGEGKQCQNILTLLTSLYILKVVDSMLVYNLIQKLIENFHEEDVEMVLLVLKTCGAEIRKDDPGSLKDAILEIQAKSMTSQIRDQSRVRFMLEMINALKNNNTRKIENDPALIEDARKILKLALKGKDSNSGIQLKVSLEDLLNAREKGKWWIIGAAWSGHGPRSDEVKTKSSDKVNIQLDEGSRVLEVARKQRMNTNLRKNIFCAMMTSEDYADAFERLLKLNLKEKQSREIMHILLDCCIQEKSYNPFYAHLAGRFCEYSRSHQVTLQYSLWDRFKVIASLSKPNCNNMALLLAYLVSSKYLSLAVFKVVSFAVLDKPSIKFLMNFFKILLLQYPETTSKAAFQRISNDPKLTLLREGIKVFLKHFLCPRKTNKGKDAVDIDKKKMKELIEISESALDGHDYIPL